MILKNKGLYLETIINNNINDWIDKNIYIQKMSISSSIISVEENILKAKINKNFFCDYCGIYNGQYLEFEAKETSLEYFSLHNIKKNQIEKLNLVQRFKGLSFIIIFFHNYNTFFGVSLSQINNFQTKKISYNWFLDNAYQIKMINLNLQLEKFLNHLINYI